MSLAIGIAAWVAFMVPAYTVKLLVDSRLGRHIRLYSDGAELKVRHHSHPVDQRLEIINSSQGESSPLCFSPLQAAFKGEVPLDRLKVVRGDWKVNEKERNWCSSEPGSILVLEHRFSTLRVPLWPATGGTSVTFKRPNESRLIPVASLDRKNLIQSVLSPLTEVYASFRDGNSVITVSGIPLKTKILEAEVSDRLEIITQQIGPITVDNFRISAHRSAFTSWGSQVVFALKTLLRLFFISLAFWLFGLILVLGVYCKQLKGMELVFVPILLGQAFLLILVSSLSLLGLTFERAFLLVSGSSLLAILLILAGAQRRSIVFDRAKVYLKSLNLARTEILEVGAVALIGALTVFQSYFFLKGMYWGENYTDTWWYLNVAEILTKVPSTVHEPKLWTFQRIADLVSIFVVSKLGFVRILEGYGLHGILSWIYTAIGMYCVLFRIQLDKATALWGAAFSAFSAIFFAVFAESYFAQFLLIQLLVGGISVTLVSLAALRSERFDLKVNILPVGIVYAAALSVYPYHFVLPVSLSFVCALAACRGYRIALPWLICVGVTTGLILNKNLLVTLNFGSNSYLMAGLNDIARYIVFPFYRTFDHILISLSLKDFHLHSSALSQIRDVLPNFARDLLGANSGSLSQGRFVVFCLVVVFSVLGVLRLLLSWNSSRQFIAITSLLFSVLTMWSFLAGQIYSYCKSLLTLAFFIPMLFLVGGSLICQSFGELVNVDERWYRSWWRKIFCLSSYRKGFVSTIAAVWLLYSVGAIMPSHIIQQVFRESRTLIGLRTHISVIRPTEIRLLEIFESSAVFGPEQLMVWGEPFDYLKSDKDRILAYFLRNATGERQILSNSELPLGWHGRDFKANLSPLEWVGYFNSPNSRYILAFERLPQEMDGRVKKILSGGIYDLYLKL